MFRGKIVFLFFALGVVFYSGQVNAYIGSNLLFEAKQQIEFEIIVAGILDKFCQKEFPIWQDWKDLSSSFRDIWEQNNRNKLYYDEVVGPNIFAPKGFTMCFDFEDKILVVVPSDVGKFIDIVNKFLDCLAEGQGTTVSRDSVKQWIGVLNCAPSLKELSNIADEKNRESIIGLLNCYLSERFGLVLVFDSTRAQFQFAT